MENQLSGLPNNQSFGQRVEDDIEWQSAMIGTLFSIKQYPAIKFFQPGRAKVVGNAYPDYIGLFPGGWMMFDAKGVSNKETFSPDTRRRHQFETLRNFSEINRYCFFLVYWELHQTGEAFLVTPTMKWKPKFQYGKGNYSGSGNLWFKEIFNKIRLEI